MQAEGWGPTLGRGSLPDWLSLSATGSLSGTPPLYGSAGSFSISVSVVDKLGATASASIPLTVNPAPLIISPATLGNAVEGAPYSAGFSASGGSGRYTWSGSGLLSWLDITAAGVLSGTPPPGSIGTYNLTITVTDSSNMSASTPRVLRVNAPPVVITSLTTLAPALELAAFKSGLAATGGVPPYRWVGSGLPSWLDLSAGGVLSGTPPAGSAGSISFGATVLDSSTLSASATFSLMIAAANSVLGIDTGEQLPPAQVGVPYNASLAAHGGKPPYKWSDSGVAGGLSLSSSGVISGTPADEGTATFTGQVTDAASSMAFRAFSLTVNSGLAVRNPPALAVAEIGVPYLQILSAGGGSQKLTWSLISGTLPPGVTLTPDGILSGTPSGAGNFIFSVAVNDKGSTSRAGVSGDAAAPAADGATQSFQIGVRPSSADLIFSEGTLPFFAVTGGTVPASQNISIITSSPAALPFTVTSDAPWLQLTPSSGITPANVAVSVDQTNLKGGAYTTTIKFATPGKAPQTVAVTLLVTSTIPTLAASPNSIRISNRSGSSRPQTGPLFVQNTGTGTLSFTTTILDAPWLSIDKNSGVILPNQTATLNFSANTTALAPGSYRGRIEIGSNNGFADIPVTLLVTTQNRLILSSAGTLLEARQDAGISGLATQSFTILASEDSPLNWTAQLAGSNNFLKLVTSSGVSTNTRPGTVSFQVDSAGLAPGSYYARIAIASPDAANSPQEFLAVLNVTPPAVPAAPNPSPAGLLFVASGSGADRAERHRVHEQFDGGHVSSSSQH